MKKETWLPVPGYEGLYSVSDLGNVISMNYANTGMLKILQPSKNGHGYFQVWLSKDKRQKSFSIHSLVAKAFIGPRPKGKEVNHKSGIKTENALTNLEYCTSSENRLHALRIGIQVPAHGEKHCRAKLKLSEVLDIKAQLQAGVKQVELARKYSIDPSVISCIARGTRWLRATAERLQ